MSARSGFGSRVVRGSAVVALALSVAGGSLAGGGALDTLGTIPEAAPLALEFDPHYVLEQVAQRMNVTLRPDIPVPQVHLESATALRRFQDAVQAQWGFRPPVVSNVYVAARNEIYLTDDAGYYTRVRRTLDESLAHELVHYLQVRYLDGDLEDPSCENDAIAIQGWFGHAHAKW